MYRIPLNPDTEILRLLLANPRQGVTAKALAVATGLNEKSLALHLDQLIELGYGIDHNPILGFQLSSLPEILIVEEIQARLSASLSTYPIQIFKETRSTNDLAHRYGKEGHAAPLLIVAESQTHGRGRQGRSWSSKPNLGLWLSFLLKPDLPPRQTPRLTILFSVALLKAIYQVTQVRAEIKWPNDLLYKGRKLAGILAEAHLASNSLSYLVVGVGCNVNHALTDFPPELQPLATSLNLVTGKKWRRVELLVALLEHTQELINQPWDLVSQQWKSSCLNMGKTITLNLPEGKVSGQMIDMDTNGSLIFRHSDGRLQTIYSGEII